MCHVGAVWAPWMELREPKIEAAVKFNPYTGAPRDPRDIESDPRGLLIVAPGAELKVYRG